MKRRYVSAVFLLIFLSMFCIISTSIVDILANPTSHKYAPLKGKQQFFNKVTGLISSVDPHTDDESEGLKKIQLEEIFQNDLSANYFNGTWITNEYIAYYDEEYNLCLYHVPSKQRKILISFVQVVSYLTPLKPVTKQFL